MWFVDSRHIRVAMILDFRDALSKREFARSKIIFGAQIGADARGTTTGPETRLTGNCSLPDLMLRLCA